MNYERNHGREGMHTATPPFGFNNVNVNDPNTFDPRPLRHRASSAPVGQSSSPPAHNVSLYPSFLAPGYSNSPQTVHRADIFFGQPTSNNFQQRSMTNVSHYATHPEHLSTIATPHETRAHRSATLPVSPPHVPPKPSTLAPRIPPYPHLPLSAPISPSPPTSLATLPESPGLQDDDDSTTPAESDLAVALALSASESNQQQEHLQQLAEQEEEELARALAASLADTGPNNNMDELERALAESLLSAKSSPNLSGDAISSTSHVSPALSSYSHNGYLETASFRSKAPVPTGSSPSSLAVSLDVCALKENSKEGPAGQGIGNQDEEQGHSELPYLGSSSPQPPVTPLKTPDATVNTDESLQETMNAYHKDPEDYFTTRSSSISPRPLVSMSQHSNKNIGSMSLSGSFSPRRELPTYPELRPARSTSSISSSLPITYPQLSSPAPSDSAANSAASFVNSSVSFAQESPNDDGGSSLSRGISVDSSSGSTSKPSPPGRSLSATAIMTTMNLNQFVDAELLFGVSIGFNPPTIATKQVKMQGALPNIISLPYGKAPPLHIQAPSWRQTLRLMARMSGSRMEPAVEAMAVSKGEMKLRTVVQFYKPHHSSPEWRTILWFTIEHPIPPDTPNAYKYHGHNVNMLPWSYSLSKPPDLLQDAADTPLSKVYVIPATDAVPYPTLPITLPNLATYLQAALDDSRKYMNDSSSGLRKLAKMVQMCYPTSNNDQIPEPAERTGMSGLFKRVMGRNNKGNKTGRGGNEDTYELVTPFVPDEWG